MFGVQPVQQLIAQQGQVMLLLEAVLFLMMGEGRLADEQDDQQDDASDEQCDDDIQMNYPLSWRVSAVHERGRSFPAFRMTLQQAPASVER